VTGARPLRVLVAEDNIINQKVATAILTRMGHTGVIVNDGEKAVRCLASLKFDVVLMDVMMPIMDGLQAVAAIREKERSTGQHQTIIMVTSHTEPGDDVRFMNAGADGYIAKPISVDQLNAELVRLGVQFPESALR
jgi:CheY-like chemotaxis protein